MSIYLTETEKSILRSNLEEILESPESFSTSKNDFERISFLVIEDAELLLNKKLNEKEVKKYLKEVMNWLPFRI